MRGALIAAVLALAGCSGQQAVLDPKSPHGALVAELWWAMLAVGALVLAAVTVLLVVGVLRRAPDGAPRPLDARQSRMLVLVGGVVIPALILFGFVLGSAMVGRVVSAAPPTDALAIEVVGRRWWWEVHYLDAAGERIATTANEIHVPVGRPVSLRLRSDNVIHSFWVPNLQGKLDLVPGQVNRAWFTANEAGTFRGQCAEFCGAQHALMAFLVVAEPASAFDEWLARERAPAAAPSSAALERGREVFERSACAGCHAIRGTSAAGTLGPDLTHLASRRTLAAGTLPNTRGHLAGWIADPQRIKPASLMPRTPLEPDELGALLAYLESLR